MKQKDLAIELLKWFNNPKDNQNKWSSPVGKIIKNQLQKTGNWKNAPRGNPRLGYQVKMENSQETP